MAADEIQQGFPNADFARASTRREKACPVICAHLLYQVTSYYHDGMTRKTTTVRLPEELADQVEVVARGRGVSVNAVVVDALVAEVEKVRADKTFMDHLRRITERDKEILDRLAE